MILFPNQIEELADQLLQAAGGFPENTRRAAEVFRRATTKGIGHHDLTYLPSRLENLVQGRVNGQASIELLHADQALETYEGNNGLGEANCHFITHRAVELASQYGLGLCSIRHSNHFLAGLPYVEIIAEAGYLGLIWSNTDASMTAPGGFSMVIGNNPLSYGVPASPAPVLFDACMAYASLGTLAAMKDQEVPSHWGIDSTGQPAKTARDILDGGVGHPIGGHKGFGLALLHEFLTAGLNGGEWGVEAPPLSGGVGVHSQTVLAIKLPDGKADLETRIVRLRQTIADRDPNARLPGVRALNYQRKVEEEGWELPETLQRRLQEWSQRLGLDWNKVTAFKPGSKENPRGL